MKTPVFKKIILTLLALCLLAAGLYFLNEFRKVRKISPTFVPGYQLIAELDQYIGKEIRTLGILVPVNPDSSFPKLRLFAFKEHLDIDRFYHEQISVRVEFKKSLGIVKIPEYCLNRYVMLGGVVGESVVPGLPAIKEVELVTVAEKDEDRLCQFIEKKPGRNP